MGKSSGKSCGKILREILVGQGGGEKQFKKDSDWWKFSIWNRVRGSQPIRIQLGKILRENLVGKFCGKFLWEILAGKSCGKILWEILVGNSCGTRRKGKSQFKKGSDWWKFSIWNRVMGSQPIRIQLGKFLWENLAGNSCGKVLWENLAEKSCGKILWEILVGKSCGKFLQENLVGKSCRKILQEILMGKSCRKILWEILAGNSCGKLLWENLAGNSAGNAVEHSPYQFQAVFEGNFQNIQFI